MARRIEQVRFRCPEKGQLRIIVSFTDGQELILKSGEILSQLKQLSREEKYGKIKAYVIYEMAYEKAIRTKNGPLPQIQELLYELYEAVEALGYVPGKMKKKQPKPARR
ncbi:hypothetical protein K0A96_00180 [Patescibacteria group bacterium]|nr:hypothetical protein [Patescibacteria group bacterium]